MKTNGPQSPRSLTKKNSKNTSYFCSLFHFLLPVPNFYMFIVYVFRQNGGGGRESIPAMLRHTADANKQLSRPRQDTAAFISQIPIILFFIDSFNV
jgi:hypothetical protein